MNGKERESGRGRGRGREREREREGERDRDGDGEKEKENIEKDSIELKRFGLKYDPPTVFVEYDKVSYHAQGSSGGSSGSGNGNGVGRRHNETFTKKIKIKNLSKVKITADALGDKLVQSHPLLLGEDKVKKEQIVALLQKLMQGNTKKLMSINTNIDTNTHINTDPDLDTSLSAFDDLLNDDGEGEVTLKKPQASSTSPTEAGAGATRMFGPTSSSSSSSRTLENETDGSQSQPTWVRSVDLNRCSQEMNAKAKMLMSEDFEANRLQPGDEGYEWEKNVDFEGPKEGGDWDEESEEED